MASSVIVGVFDNSAMADHALEGLYNAGLGNDQILYSGHATQGQGLFAGMRRAFTDRQEGSTAASGILRALQDFGIPEEEARYYAHEYEVGRAVVAVKPGDREQEALTILRSSGGYGYNARPGSPAVGEPT
jgi:hypothetical protein